MITSIVIIIKNVMLAYHILYGMDHIIYGTHHILYGIDHIINGTHHILYGMDNIIYGTDHILNGHHIRPYIIWCLWNEMYNMVIALCFILNILI